MLDLQLTAEAWPIPRSRDAPATRERVLDAAVEVIADRGADRARYQDVAAIAGVSVGTLQYKFGSLEDLLIAAFRHAVERDLQYLASVSEREASPWDRLVGFVDTIFTDDEHFPQARRVWIEFWRFAMRRPELTGVARLVYGSWRDVFERTIRAGVEQGTFRLRRPLDGEITLLFATLDGITIPILLGIEPAIEDARRLLIEQLAWQLGVDADARS